MCLCVLVIFLIWILDDFGTTSTLVTITQLEFAEGWCLGHVRKDIFQYIISELGSLERMDEQIRALMAEMLMRNLANVEKATGSLVDRLGQGSATVATVYEERF